MGTVTSIRSLSIIKGGYTTKINKDREDYRKTGKAVFLCRLGKTMSAYVL